MKNLIQLFVFAFILFLTSESTAQWIFNYTLPNASWAGRAEFVDEATCWGVMGFNNGAEGFFRTSDGGNNWAYDSLGSLIYAIHPRSYDTAYIGTVINGLGQIIKTTNGGNTWDIQSSAFGIPVSFMDYVYFFDDNNGFAMADPATSLFFEIYTTTNAGENWVKVLNSGIPRLLTNEYPSNLAFSVVGNTIFVPVKIYQGDKFRLFKSTDRGLSWTASAQFTTNLVNGNPFSISFQDSLNGFLIFSSLFSSGFTSSEYQMFKTTDGGNSWIGINFPLLIDPAFISKIPNVPAGYFVCAPINNTGTAYTLDGGTNWIQVDNKAIWDINFLSSDIGWAFDWNAPTIYKWDGPALPVELTSFTAEAFDQKVMLKWTTATELNNNGFEIQRRVAESDFSTIGFVRGEGTTTNPKEYSYFDKDLVDGKYFYRLKQVDFNGTYEYSDIIEVDIRSLNEYTLEQNYPNPFNPTTTIGYVLKEKTTAKLILLNAIGEQIAVLVNEEQDKGFHKVDFNAANLSSGVYFYQLKAGDPSTGSGQVFVQTRKMILLK